MIARCVIAIIAAITVTGCYDSFHMPQQHNTFTRSYAISSLHSSYDGEPFTVSEDIYIVGRVVSSDRAGNFYRTFVVCDESGGAEIMAGINDIHSVYPYGSQVKINLLGCAVSESLGVMQIGLPAEKYENRDVDYFYSKVNLDKHIERGSDVVDIEIPVLRICELEKSMCGCPVTVEALSASEENIDRIWFGYHIFEDHEGNKILTYTSRYADFAEDMVPDAAMTITGILQYGKVAGEERFIIKMRDREDCAAYNN